MMNLNGLLESLKNVRLIDFETEQARRSFWHYCKLREPDFYFESREHLKLLCTILNNFYYRLPLDETGAIYRKLAIHMPPQHGKTRTLVNWFQWILGKNNQERIIVGAYNELVASDMGVYTRDGIKEIKNTPDQIVYSDIFPKTKIKYGAESKMKWALDGQHFNFLSTSPGGTATGKGATVRGYDDLIKNDKEAFNDDHLKGLYQWMIGTMESRNDANANNDILEFMCMTKWSTGDPAGRRMLDEPGQWFVLSMPAYDTKKDEMLCSDFLNKEKYESMKNIAFKNDTTRAIFLANYQQECIDIQGRLYKNFKTYSKLPQDQNENSLIEYIGAYADTADEGSDYLVNIIYGAYRGLAYILDVYMTKDGMEITEEETAKRLFEFNVNRAKIESNNGGRGFARNVQRILWEKFKSKSTIIKWFHQSQNKKARILSQSANVQENVLYPVDWMDRWPEYTDHMKKYQKEGKNTHDDPEDAITGVVENINSDSVSILRPKNAN